MRPVVFWLAAAAKSPKDRLAIFYAVRINYYSAVMLDSSHAYPIKLVSRTAERVRTRKLRLTWLVVGLAFGLGCTSALTPMFNQDAPLEAQTETVETPVLAAAEPIPQPSVATIATPNVAAYPLAFNLKVEKGDTFISLLTDAGVPYDEAQNVAASIRSVFNPRKLGEGSKVALQLDKGPDGGKIIRSMKLPVSALSTIEVARAKDDSFIVKKVDAPVFKKLAHVGGRIDSSLYQTGAEAGIPPAMLNEIINAYSYDVDFQREIKQGNAMDVLFERLETKDGAIASNGNLVYAELELSDRRLKLYRYTDKSGNADFYNERGESIRKALLRTPINGAKITSGYGMRNHPLLGYTKMHRGVDFGAPIGTPIYAAGDGTVEFVGQKGGYGNYLKLKHNGLYSSAYAHLSRFASGIAPGKRVKQGQIVAYVGTTGASTGPHLHYEILAGNDQVNPANVKFKTGQVLAGKELLAFRDNMNKVEAKLASIARGNAVAMAEKDAIGTATN